MAEAIQILAVCMGLLGPFLFPELQLKKTQQAADNSASGASHD
jgi:hypothetical protein